MTAILGIMAYADSKNKKIILASDSQLNETDEKDDTILAKAVGFSKIAAGEYWAMGFTGTYRPEVRAFFRFIRQKKNMSLVEKAVRDKFFQEVNKLNTKICDKAGENNISSYLLAATKPEIGLYFIDVFGNVKKRPVEDDDEISDYLALGSGKKFVKTFLESKIGNNSVDQDGITAGLAVRLAYDAIDKNDDPGTGGPIELFTIGEDGVNNYGQRLRKTLRKVLKSELEAIARELSPRDVRKGLRTMDNH